MERGVWKCSSSDVRWLIGWEEVFKELVGSFKMWYCNFGYLGYCCGRFLINRFFKELVNWWVVIEVMNG